MDKKDKERKEYQQAMVNMEQAFHTFDDSIKIMTNSIDFQYMSAGELNEVTSIVLKISKLCKKVAEMAKKHKAKRYSEEIYYDEEGNCWTRHN